ncbi:DUF488 domain-containing protein [Chryseosolibacter indicus]|uniref:DUF488 domain-containing protein n=1 Tax=Chryseosolibacter indicus TaxID=2782351 RepID=A0ABS5VZV3_9BACT|nr:DUF488 domain-containing protein [Chryseosolibacter indicus]MBT1706387.1 DUF488 domain-containing protein [Chryseosolibacter indicus]
MAQLKTIWTIGHSTRSFEEFTRMLGSFKIEQLVDVRHFPGSRKYPHFNKLPLGQSLAEAGIRYEHLESLGGRRKAKEHSNNTAWRHPAFRGYADYMETADFKEGMQRLEEIAGQRRTAFMCSEAVWWRCHRSLISDLLKVKGWSVLHIMDVDKTSEHPFTSAAKVTNGELSYSA